MSKTPSNLAQALARVRSGESLRQVSAATGIPRSTLRHHAAKVGLAADPHGSTKTASKGGVHERTTGRDGTTFAEAEADTPDKVLTAHGMKPDEWVVTSTRITKGSGGQTWFRVGARPKVETALVVPALDTTELPSLRGDAVAFSHGSVVFLADPHLPYLNQPLWQATLRYLQDEEPSLVVFLGDAGDHNRISKHRGHRRFIATINETNDAVAKFFYAARFAAPDAEFIFIPGNHDARILNYMLDYAADFADVRPGRLPVEDKNPDELITLQKFYRLDDLGIKYIDEHWKLASYPVVSELTARHGHLTGQSAERKMLEKHGRSQVHGHLHRGEQIYRTKHDPLDIRMAMSVPCLCEVKVDGLGYEPEPDWTPGIGLAHVWDDETFVASIAPFIKNELLIPDGRRYSGED